MRGMPLSVRILWFLLLNLLIAVGLLGWVLKGSYGLGKDSLIENTVESRMESMVRLLMPALNGSELSEWNDILEHTGDANGVELALVSPDGARLLAGSERELPSDLAQQLQEKYPPRAGRPGRRRRLEMTEENHLDALMDDGPPGGPGRDPDVRNGRMGRIDIEAIGEFGAPKHEMAALHFWIEAGNRKPNDLMLIVWKRDNASQVFFSWTPLFFITLALLLVTALIWVPFVYRITRRLGILTQGAESIAEGQFEIDVASDRSDELGRLSRSVQGMAQRLDEYVTGQKRFLGDIAHELCSPLVRLRMGLGVLEHQLGDEDQSRLGNLNEEVEELSQLVNELLDFSKASLKPDKLEFETVNLLDLCSTVVAREAGDRPVALSVPEGLTIQSRGDLLKRAIGNLVRNAVRYTDETGMIAIRVESSDSGVVIAVEDEGPGLPEAWLEKVFEPFSRPDDARAREHGGSGLGMAIAKTCITGLGGDIRCENRPEGGLAVIIRL